MMKMRKFIWMLVFAITTVVLSDGMLKNNNVAMAEEANYYDAELINVTKSYNMGENANMTGGTAGTIFPGEKLRIIRKDTSNNKYGYCYYVYAINAGIYGYVSPSYVKVYNVCVYIENKQDTEQNHTDTEQRYDAKLINVSKSYNLGLNANMTGGTAGTVYPGEKFQVIRKDTSNNKYGYCYYVYAINAGIYGYVSPTYIELVTEKLEYIPYDLANHLISVTSANGDTTYTFEKHNWVSNECSICGCTRTEKATYSKTNDLYHKVSIEYTYPIDGGKTKKNATEEHTFENGKCVKCGRKQASNEKGLYVTLNKVTVYKGTNSLTGRAKTLKKGVEVTITEVVTNAYNNLWGKLSDGSGYVWMANLEAADETKRDALVEKLDILVEKLGGKYFTVNQKACRNSADRLCLVENVVKGSIDGKEIKDGWLKNSLLGGKSVSVTQFPKLTVDSSKKDNNGYSCFGFACFAQWYLYSGGSKDTVTASTVATGKYNKEFLQANVQTGDALRIMGKKGAHTVIVYSVDEDGLTVVDSNFYLDCKVSRHSLEYTHGSFLNQTVYVDRVVD